MHDYIYRLYQQILYGSQSEICIKLEIPNVTEREIPKHIVKDALKIHNCKEIKREMEKLKKLKAICNEDYTSAKTYLSNKSIEESRTLFRIRTNMVELKSNMKGSFKQLRS